MTPQPPFYSGQPASVRAVIELAESRSEINASAWDRIVDAFAPAHADSIRQIAEDLVAIERFTSDRSVDALWSYYGPGYRAMNPRAAADETRERLEREVVMRAQLVASLLRVAA